MCKLTIAATLLTALTAGAAAADDPKKEDVDKAEAKVKEFIAKLPNGQEGQVVSLNNADTHGTIANHLFFAVRYRIYPVARVMPEGYRASNIMAVNKDGKVERVKDVKALTELFKANMTPVKDKDVVAARKSVRAWLTLTQEFHQDGFFKFELPQQLDVVGGASKGGKDSRMVAQGRLIVMAGGNGDLTAALTFADGKLQSVLEEAKIREGPRPICQATKLLDADPIVRKMAEQDLLYMGLAARDYIMDQRANAGPDLREAIDRLWRRIEKNGW